MKPNHIYRGIVFTVAFFLAGGVALAQDKEKSAAPAGQPDMAEAAKRMEAYSTPGPEHKLLAQMAGNWDTEGKFYMGGPGSEPTVTKGSQKAETVLDGRFLKEEFTGDFMGQPFHGLGFTGYDNFKKKYVSVWMDGMGTGIFMTEGAADASGKTITLTGKMNDPATGDKDAPVRCVLKLISEDKHTFELHDARPNGKGKLFEMTYTRKK